MDKILNKEARNTMEALIRHKIRKLLQEKLSKNIGKPKELWKIKKPWVYQTQRFQQQAYVSIQKKS